LILIIGVITLESDFQICKEGDMLTPEQARLLVRKLLILKLKYLLYFELKKHSWKLERT